jgi:hypothetical protein
MNRPKTAVTATCISRIQADIYHQEAAHKETVHQAVAHLIRINHIIAAQALQVHHQMYMVMTIAEAIQADQQVVHHITAARVIMIHMMKDMMISI